MTGAEDAADDRQGTCARCGRREYGDLPDDDDAVVWPTRWLYAVGDGAVCWECMTEREQRREDAQCLRCGRQYDEDSDNPDDNSGWITPDWMEPSRSADYLCPACTTDAEAQADAQWFIDQVREGQQLAQLTGDEYPADLAALAQSEARWLRSRRAQDEALRRALDADDQQD